MAPARCLRLQQCHSPSLVFMGWTAVQVEQERYFIESLWTSPLPSQIQAVRSAGITEVSSGPSASLLGGVGLQFAPHTSSAQAPCFT